jgi:hypothetical protein
MRRELLVLLFSCATSPSRHPTSMEALPPPPPEEPQHLLVPENGVTRLVVGPDTALCTADDRALVEVWGKRDELVIVGRKRGHTLLHVERPGKGRVDIDVEVGPGAPDARALAVGETVMLSAEGVREWSESGPGFVTLSPTEDGKQILVTGRRPGTNVVLFIRADGSERTLELTVVGGDRQL